ncbi:MULTISPECIES: SRPBCC domain-containing protein [Halorussus]|uniref:SRPBCC domain-containing protein n=1 Tax=Halorussus TaxID=1070314 RepID=UPI00209F5528|nr:SRPBCC domain-containing protein [Halorussus vallis]USZ75190.1 SRPBCC domain-containing protein [Halorussus vallis]
MREIRTELEIDAPSDVVWDVLTDLSTYPKWNPHVTAANGDLREGSEVDIKVQPGGSRSRSMNVTVTALEPRRKLEWVGTVLSPWLFEGRHTFELEPLGDDRTRFVNRERLRGVLVRFVVADDAERDYEAMNLALAERAESRYAAETTSEP